MSIITTVKASRPFQKFTRVLQFLSAIISLGMFSARVAKLATTGLRIGRASNGSVIAILASAVLYTLVSMVIRFLLKKKIAPTWMRWVWIIFDIIFVISFIIVAVLTRPNGGSSGPDCTRRIGNFLPEQLNCNLPWGTFILAIVSTILHFLTAVFNEVKDHYNNNKLQQHELEKQEQRNHV